MPDSLTPSPSEDPAEALAAAVALRRLAASRERSAVDLALAEDWTWAKIGQALGMTAQAAHKRLSPSRRTPLNEELRHENSRRHEEPQ